MCNSAYKLCNKGQLLRSGFTSEFSTVLHHLGVDSFADGLEWLLDEVVSG